MHHLNFLAKCIDNKLVPKSFQINIISQIMSSEETTIMEDWETTLVNTSKELVELIQMHYTILVATFNEKTKESKFYLAKLKLTSEHTIFTEQQKRHTTNLEHKFYNTRPKKL